MDISYSLLTNRLIDNAINNTITILNQSEESVLDIFDRYGIPNEADNLRNIASTNDENIRNLTINSTPALPNISPQPNQSASTRNNVERVSRAMNSNTPSTHLNNLSTANQTNTSNITSTTSLIRTTSNILNMNRNRRSLDRTRYPIIRSNTNSSTTQTSTQASTQTTQNQPARGRISNVNISNIRYQNNFRLFNNN